MKYRTRTIYTPEQKAQKMIKSGGIPCLRVQAGRIGPIEAISKGSYEVFGLVDTS
jgi:hypothetical protein